MTGLLFFGAGKKSVSPAGGSPRSADGNGMDSRNSSRDARSPSSGFPHTHTPNQHKSPPQVKYSVQYSHSTWIFEICALVRVDKSSGFVKHWYKSISGEVPGETDVNFELLDRLNYVIH